MKSIGFIFHHKWVNSIHIIKIKAVGSSVGDWKRPVEPFLAFSYHQRRVRVGRRRRRSRGRCEPEVLGTGQGGGR